MARVMTTRADRNTMARATPKTQPTKRKTVDSESCEYPLLQPRKIPASQLKRIVRASLAESSVKRENQRNSNEARNQHPAHLFILLAQLAFYASSPLSSAFI
jgi:hypothetical protein